MAWILRCAVALLAVSALAAHADDWIRYRTADGHVGFADNPQAVPKGATIIKTPSPAASHAGHAGEGQKTSQPSVAQTAATASAPAVSNAQLREQIRRNQAIAAEPTSGNRSEPDADPAAGEKPESGDADSEPPVASKKKAADDAKQQAQQDCSSPRGFHSFPKGAAACREALEKMRETEKAAAEEKTAAPEAN